MGPTVNERLIGTAALVAAVGTGIVGGVLFAFSTFVMRALDDLDPPEAIRTMQAINVRAVNPIFMGLFFGTGLLTVVVAGVSVMRSEQDPDWRLATAALLYIVTIAITAAYHVPHNDTLARVNSTDANSAQIWHTYSSGWTNWNHLRMLTAIASSALLVASSTRISVARSGEARANESAACSVGDHRRAGAPCASGSARSVCPLPSIAGPQTAVLNWGTDDSLC